MSGQQSEVSRQRWKDIVRMVIFLGIGFFFIYWFLLKLDPDQKAAIWNSLREADYGWVAVAMACCLLSHFIRALRWRLLFRPLGLHPTLNHTFGSVVIAYMGNLAFPRAGEVMRCATLRTSEGIPLEKSLGTVVTERIIDLLAFGIIVLLGMLLLLGKAKDWLYDTLSEKFTHLPNMAMIIGALVVLAVLAFVAYKLFWHKLLHIKLFAKVDELVRGMADGVKSVFHMGWKRSLMFLVYSAAIYMLYILGGLIIFWAFDLPSWMGLPAAFVVYLAGTVGMTFSQGGIGVYPALVMMALTTQAAGGLGIYNIAPAVSTACGWMLWGSQQAAVIVVGGAYMVYFSIKKKRNSNG